MSIFEFFVFIEDILSCNILYFVLMLVDLNNFLPWFFFFFRFLLTHFFHICYLFRRCNLVKFPLLPEFIHHLKHVILQTQSSISLSIEIDLNNQAVLVDVNPPNIAVLQIDLVVQPWINYLFLKGKSCCIDDVKGVLVVGISLQDKNCILLNKFPFSKMNMVERAGVNHLVLIYLSLFNQNIIETNSFLASYATAHIFVGALLNTLINWYSR